MSDSPHIYIPLLVPVAGIPVVGKPLADLLQPVLTQIVNLGYDNPANEGWDVGQANVPTGFGIFPYITSELSHPASLLAGLASGAGTSGSADLLSSPTDLVSAFTSALFTGQHPDAAGAAKSAHPRDHGADQRDQHIRRQPE